jgi:predicted nuclease of predicted toxin-antitoxin system
VTRPRFLIDENLLPHLTGIAHDNHYAAAHVNHLGLRGEKDWDLLKLGSAEEWTLVTNNAMEFRGRYRLIDLHPGIVLLIPSVSRFDQLRLFMSALRYIEHLPNMINRALDITLGPQGEPVVKEYKLP